MDNKGAFRRRMDLMFVQRGGVIMTLDSISNFLAAVDVEPDTLTIQRYIKQQQQHAAAVAAEGDEGRGALSPRSPLGVVSPRRQSLAVSMLPPASPTSSPTSGGALRALSIPRVSLSDCFELAHQCLEVQHRRTVGGNEAHYLQLAWLGCGGDEDRKGSIPRSTIMSQLSSIGVETGFDSPAGYSSDTEEAPLMMTFQVSVSKEVLESAARCSDPSKLVLMRGGMTSEELKAARAQALALVNFKLRMRGVVAARRRRRSKEKREQEEAAAVPRVASIRFGPGGGGGGHRGGKAGVTGGGGRRGSTINGPIPLLTVPMVTLPALSPQLSVPPDSHSPPGASGRLTSKPKSRAERIHNRKLAAAPSTATTLQLQDGILGSNGPDILHLDTSSSPWNLHHPFLSTKVKTDWIRQGSPPPPRRGQSSDDDGDGSPSIRSGSPGRLMALGGGEPLASLPALKLRLAQLLREQVSSHRAKLTDDAITGTVVGSKRLSPVSYHDEMSLIITASEARDAITASSDVFRHDRSQHRIPSSSGSGGGLVDGEGLHVKFNDTLETTLLLTTTTSQQLHTSKTVACQCNEADIILDIYGLNVPKQLRATLRAAQWKQSEILNTSAGVSGKHRSKQRKAGARKAGAARLPPLPHAGRF
ncbi:Hypothetical protein, putative [Bodo saltans]|uniref:Uncharacterized protein n=1 Tax=Bodo saltans TaxID=75058 RepID=A0A0S4JG08_BODSA|nr:Hypothetical protein, putative [Bodo saltans]|eukprot:CUG90491.1 Hypothetical protein, putative [Bodo saltans]